MTRSRRRKLSRKQVPSRSTTVLRGIVRAALPLAALAAAAPLAHADTPSGGLQAIVITAQKIRQNLQNVPISVEVFDNRTMRQLNIANIDDYVKMAPAVSFVRSQGEGSNGGPGGAIIYIRDVVSGGDGNHSGSEPSVGVYLDQQPVTTITGVVPVHMYDINRIEVLEGPQGTLFGSSAEAGAVRIITNKPNPDKFSAGYDLQENIIQDGGPGHVFQGYVNIPLWSRAAIRLVAWDVHHGGYISNVAGTDANGCIFNGVRSFPSWAIQTNPSYYATSSYTAGSGQCAPVSSVGKGAITAGPWLKNNYNTSDTYGGRVELRFHIGKDWTVTPSFQGQSISANGFFGYDPAVGYLKLTHFGPETSHDTWDQLALTIEGKVHDFDIVYTGGFLKRNQHSIADYSDYSEFYDKVNGSGAYYTGNAGTPIMPQQFVIGAGDFEMWSQEVRVTTPLDEPVHATVGAYIGRQMHNIWQNYTMPGFGWTSVYGGNPDGLGYTPSSNPATDVSVPGYPNTIWLTDEQRVDRDRAVYAQATWDITPKWHLTGGMRFYHYDNSLIGFYGFNANFFTGEGTATCFLGPIVKNSPCTDLDASTSGSGSVPRVNLTYQITPNAMVYATYSKGYRPGGVNRIAPPVVVAGQVPAPSPYQADYLTNYEVGWKTQWFHNTLRWNGAVFWEEWKNFQFSFLGANSVTIIANGGNARIRGIENTLAWVPVHSLYVSANFAFTDPVLTSNYYGCIPGTPPCTPLPAVEVPSGTNLPVAPKFKGNVVVRYTLPMMGDWKPYVQLAGMYQNQTASALLLSQNAVYGNLPAYALFNLKIGANAGNGMHVDLFISNLMNRLAEYSRFTESNPSLNSQVYILPAQPRTFGIEFGQDF
jgi:outer membrane receptor protein involved in Fe transport